MYQCDTIDCSPGDIIKYSILLVNTIITFFIFYASHSYEDNQIVPHYSICLYSNHLQHKSFLNFLSSNKTLAPSNINHPSQLLDNLLIQNPFQSFFFYNHLLFVYYQKRQHPFFVHLCHYNYQNLQL